MLVLNPLPESPLQDIAVTSNFSGILWCVWLSMQGDRTGAQQVSNIIDTVHYIEAHQATNNRCCTNSKYYHGEGIS